VPTPVTESLWDGWLYHSFFSVRAGDVTIAGAASRQANQQGSTLSAIRLDVDSKAMRKLRIEDAVYAMIEVVIGGTATMVVDFNSRTLLKLP